MHEQITFLFSGEGDSQLFLEGTQYEFCVRRMRLRNEEWVYWLVNPSGEALSGGMDFQAVGIATRGRLLAATENVQ